ncbi:aspartate aminotransferase family protein [Natrinema salifodinae]|uniref:4-aminobutyrate aminotransferase / (S)-3-amino-2-methylpropionate transaminase n=1 Tax=Natrinema salifodinae TaxID=1202768 RepID=A0A1I0M5I8_9EURY|nr:aspartate aminotransferase family protein [Natrinema salifodinae]SEV83737.1 4-aminobutyrate aminotransferase / (S)-3-amino-2-methylpropionate transaminase [Natrinema salifodinae]
MSRHDAVSNETLETRYDEYMMPIWKSLNVPLRRASDCTVEDFDGNEYLDVFSGISVTNVGHRNDAVVDAAKAQLDEFVHGCSYVHPNRPVADLAERIAEITPGDLRKSFFCNSGTEAVEGAIKLARKYTGSKEVVALEMGFHGRTLGSLALTGNHTYKREMGPAINDAVHAPAPYRYRWGADADSEAAFADRAAAEIEHVIGTHTSDDLAAIVVEPVMGEGGIVVPPKGWLERVAEIAHDHDALLIADEVQTGYGRTGSMFATEHFDATPDILTQAKGIANGLPLGAFTASPEIADAFESGDHLSTFGGNPVACAAALATIDELEGGIVAETAEKGAWLDDELAALEDDFDVVGDTRGLGLMQGIELVDPTETGPRGAAPAPAKALAATVGDELRDRGIIVGVGGYYKNVVRFQPPLTITTDQLDRTLGELRAVLEEVTADA